MEYNKFMPDQRRLASTKLEDMKVEWQPHAVIFANGTTLKEESEAAPDDE
jgi:hypothetical protein